jgi:hypothetical protein
MGWQPNRDSWPGDVPGQDNGLPDLLAGFEHDGSWATEPPSARLALALEEAAGPENRYERADTDAMVGIVKQWAAVESWAAAGKLAGLRAMMRDDSEGRPLLRRRTDLPEGWDDSLNYEIAAALAMGPVSAGNLAALAWTLGTRLPGIGRLLADGTLTTAKARLVAQTLEPLDETEAARAEALVLPELAGKTYFQVERLAWRAALAVAPDVAERRRSTAERTRARVTVFREDAGTVGLSGRDLPAAEALSGHANVLALAAQYEASGAFPGRTASSLQALAYLDLLNGVRAADRIAFAGAAATEPPTSPAEPSDSPPDNPAEPPDCPARPSDCPEPATTPEAEIAPEEQTAPATETVWPAQPVLPEVTVPLVTLHGQAERPGENRLLGPLDPVLARSLAAAAARSPASRWEVTIVDEHGYAVGHGVARPQRGRRRGQGPEPPPSPLSALPARVNITVTETYLRRLIGESAQPRPGAPPEAWNVIPRNDSGTWTLTLPGGRELTVRFDTVPTHACDHRYRVSAYLPGDRLRRLVQVRDHECTFPTCSRPAHESDFEHAVPYDQGGATDACNAGARSRRCHQVKQLPGWNLTQPKPGWHAWTTPTGRTYVQGPWRYPA